MSTGNTIKTVVLLLLLTALFILVGDAIGGRGGMLIAFTLAIVMNVSSYWFSDKIALSMAGAHEVSSEQAPQLHRLVEELATYARLPKPRVYMIDSDSPNAFATGRDPEHSAVAVTKGIMGILSQRELEGVLAHEMGHVKNRDILITTVVATIAGAIMMLADMARWGLMFVRSDDEEGEGIGGMVGTLLLVILAPIAAMLIQLAISRAREYDADAMGARILGQPDALANALEKLEMGTKRLPLATANAATAPLFIVSPFAGGIQSWLSTHPPIEERVRRLRQMHLQPGAYGMRM